jgi:hypothetical protein
VASKNATGRLNGPSAISAAAACVLLLPWAVADSAFHLGENRPELLVLPLTGQHMRRSADALERHAKAPGDGLAALVARVDIPAHPPHAAPTDRPIDEVGGRTADQSASLHLGHEPDTELAHRVSGIEYREDGAANDPAIEPDAIEMARIARMVIGEALQELPGAVHVGNGMSERNPRGQMVPRMGDRGRELLGVPRLQLSQPCAVAKRIKEHDNHDALRSVLRPGGSAPH